MMLHTLQVLVHLLKYCEGPSDTASTHKISITARTPPSQLQSKLYFGYPLFRPHSLCLLLLKLDAADLCVLYVYSTMELNLNAKYHSISIPV